jgi:mevalonate kinase
LKFNAKILLFGEYTILHHSDALVVPYPKFSGNLDFINKNATADPIKLQSNKLISSFFNSLQQDISSFGNEQFLNLSQLQNDIDEGLYFSSNIPMGYGVGSSGALSAAIYYKYAINSSNRSQPIDNLRKSLSIIESIFHGNSSGLDPLVSYMNRGLYIHNQNVRPQEINVAPFHPFLIDTMKPRSTENLVKLYRQKCSSSDFMAKINLELVAANNKCIRYLSRGDVKNFFGTLKLLSKFQLEHLSEMILPQQHVLWREGIDSDRFYLKLCGAGGGGYVLGFTPNVDATMQVLDSYKLISIWV